MKRTKIHYVNTADDNIRIERIENAASPVEIRSEFGQEVERVYFGENGPAYWAHRDTIHICPGDVKFANTIYVNTDFYNIHTHAEFALIIALMKASGKRLQDIRDHADNNAVKCVEI